MDTIYGYDQIPDSLHGAIATIGNFDGVHLGHQALIRRLQQKQRLLRNKKQLNCGMTAVDKATAYKKTVHKTVVILFDPQPKEYFSPQTAPPRLYTLEQKLDTLRSSGVDAVLVLKFDDCLRQLSSTDFVHHILLNGLHIRHLVIGDDFRFGNDRKGDFDLLSEYARKNSFSLEQAPSLQDHSERISSTLVRQCLQQGDINRATRLLGRPYQVCLDRTEQIPNRNSLLIQGRLALDGNHKIAYEQTELDAEFRAINIESGPATRIRLKENAYLAGLVRSRMFTLLPQMAV